VNPSTVSIMYPCTILDSGPHQMSLRDEAYPIVPRVGDHILVTRMGREDDYVAAPVTLVLLDPRDGDVSVSVEYPSQPDGSPW
jgi:hypothetical protein